MRELGKELATVVKALAPVAKEQASVVKGIRCSRKETISSMQGCSPIVQGPPLHDQGALLCGRGTRSFSTEARSFCNGNAPVQQSDVLKQQ